MINQPLLFERAGIIYKNGVFIFTVRCREDSPVSLILYKIGSAEIEREIPFPSEKVLGDYLMLQISDLKPGTFEYNYRMNGKVIQDPYAVLLCDQDQLVKGQEENGQEEKGEHQVRCGFYLDAYDWQDDRPPKIPFADSIIYQLHVRGFTRHSYSKVKAKGTFQGITEKVEYLKSLGITAIKLMPAYEFYEWVEPPKDPGNPFETISERKVNFWGYAQGNYFAPKRAYAATKNPVKEFKDMVRIMHTNGIEVIMELFFPGDVHLGKIMDCLRYWILEYHIDGFHLLGNEHLFQQIPKDPAFSGIKLINLYYDAATVCPQGKIPKERKLAECNDGFMITARRLLKGDENQLDDFVYRVNKNPSQFAVLNYITNHSGFTLLDLVSYDDKHNEANGEENQDGPNDNYSWNCGAEGATRRQKVLKLRSRQMRNAFLMLLLSQGAPMIRGGDEFGNSQDGNNNPYCQDNETGWLDWRAARKHTGLTDFVKDTIAFRKRYKILHMSSQPRLIDSLACGYPDVSYHGDSAWYCSFDNKMRQIGIMYCGIYAKEDTFIYVAYNLHWLPYKFALPSLKKPMNWHVAIDSGVGVYPMGEEPKLAEEKRFVVPERTIMVLVGRK